GHLRFGSHSGTVLTLLTAFEGKTMSKNTRNIIVTAIVAFAMGMGLAFAGPMRAHKNLEAAQRDLNLAWDHITASQNAHEWDEGGHAEKAKGAIQEAKE